MLPNIPAEVFSIKDKHFPTKQNIIKLRPFSVAQEAIFLRAKDGDESDKVDSIVQIISECIVQPTGLDVATLPLPVIQLILVRLREHSIGEVIPFAFKCKAEKDGVECGKHVDTNLNLKDATITDATGFCDTFKLAGDMTIKLTPPTLSSMSVGDSDNSLMIGCMSSLTVGEDEFYDMRDSPVEEKEAFFAQVPLKSKLAMKSQFFDKLPSMKLETKIKCPNCGYEHNLSLDKVDDFF